MLSLVFLCSNEWKQDVKSDKKSCLTAVWTLAAALNSTYASQIFCQINHCHITQRSDANFCNTGGEVSLKLYGWDTQLLKQRSAEFNVSEGDMIRKKKKTDFQQINYSSANKIWTCGWSSLKTSFLLTWHQNCKTPALYALILNWKV